MIFALAIQMFTLGEWFDGVFIALQCMDLCAVIECRVEVLLLI